MKIINGVSKSERLKWQAEDDARTLAAYQEIMNDKNRMNRAVKAAEQQAKDLSKRANIMSNAVKIGKSNSSKKKK